jgi:hypothetical protein
MRHLKRFKNWLAVVYYACWSVSEQYRQKNEQNQVTFDDACELEADIAAQLAAQQSEDSEVSAQQQQAALEMLDAIAGTSEKTAAVVASEAVAPRVEVKKNNKAQKPVEVKPVQAKQKAQPAAGQPVTTESVASQPASTEPVASPPVKTQPATTQPVAQQPASKSAVKQQGSNGAAPVPQPTTGKYQPGAINEQTAQRLARLLVSEIKLYHKSKSEGEAPTDGMNIYDMLKDPIEKSRQHYKQRMGKTAIETMPDYFHGELVRSLCGGDASRLGPNYRSLDESA